MWGRGVWQPSLMRLHRYVLAVISTGRTLSHLYSALMHERHRLVFHGAGAVQQGGTNTLDSEQMPEGLATPSSSVVGSLQRAGSRGYALRGRGHVWDGKGNHEMGCAEMCTAKYQRNNTQKKIVFVWCARAPAQRNCFFPVGIWLRGEYCTRASSL